jgi:triacylglycerol esterase/lipase EstA (alpha/beta hydrolase family)
VGTGVLALGVGIVVGVAVFLLATYVHHWMVEGSFRRAARALPREFLAELWAVVSWPWFGLAGASYRSSRPASGPRPVILLHGYGMNRMCFAWLGRALARRGLGPLHAMSYVSLRSVRSSARELARFVEKICHDARVPDVDLICHSLGGIVARYYAERLGGAARVKHLVTIGTPHRGTLCGRAALGRSGQDLRPRSDVLLELAACPRPAGIKLISIYSRADNVIVPADSAAVGSAGEDVVFEHLGHMGLLMSPRVADAIATRLSGPPAVAAARAGESAERFARPAGALVEAAAAAGNGAPTLTPDWVAGRAAVSLLGSDRPRSGRRDRPTGRSERPGTPAERSSRPASGRSERTVAGHNRGGRLAVAVHPSASGTAATRVAPARPGAVALRPPTLVLADVAEPDLEPATHNGEPEPPDAAEADHAALPVARSRLVDA